ncbi:phosphoribosylglycinamide formyltransferase chloroplastic [Tripterygium wilfordii]|uniref:Phosphoribosylglycinamide formyltransferase, chloroplastic n=1 Tax=Tripterygium wilfordii TaxID=458696 RepID=A0A7J7CNP5_TRIWF|nr:phosphoribosylglycinamide formyltransferase, chloroplastic isoform X1 [Tripterygium wilfordii]XP_038724522.1 phosphoribosylglycinamide formyltransferase, chloroplastic isoform X1 [Tripterygium wilfordii]XP_038724523.1 phosphoribosylglycinamide formyltransferase, chloroplastic isoform X1 [Tripterygium wilfordii]KAF5735671.1 phosphoribosylglycinamide formyltransferase chloroplastic [Tripterygium wilfordii]
MKAQNFRSGFCSNPSISVPPKHSLKLPSISSICVTQSRKWTQSISTVKAWSENRLQCRNCVEKQANDVVLAEEDLEYGVKRKKFAVFVSGGGSNFKSINEACGAGLVLGDVVVLVTNKQGCGGAEYARTKGIPVILFPKAKDEPNGLSPTDLVNALRGFEVDFILLAGYVKLIPLELIRAYPRSILNIHPALLPAFGGKGYYGMKVHEAVVASGARYSGPTIHFVDEHYDTGRILAQRVVPVLANDSPKELAARVLREEHKLYVEVVAALCEERIFWREDGVPLIRDKDDPNEYI